jgi:hypothetical protein
MERPTSALSRLGLRLGVFVGTFFDGKVSIMNLCLHSRPSGLRASRWAQKEGGTMPRKKGVPSRKVKAVIIGKAKENKPSISFEGIINTIERVGSIFLIPLTIAIIGYYVQKAISDQSVSKDYVSIAVSILNTKESVSPELRSWAVDLLLKTSPVKIDPVAEEKLRNGEITLPELSYLQDLNELSAALANQVYQTPEIQLSPEETVIKFTIENYYNNIPNDRINNLEINTEIAWNQLSEKLQSYFGKDKWLWNVGINPQRYMYLTHPSDWEENKYYHVETPFASVDIYLAIYDLQNNKYYQDPNTITICLINLGGQWKINEINITQQSLQQCKS